MAESYRVLVLDKDGYAAWLDAAREAGEGNNFQARMAFIDATSGTAFFWHEPDQAGPEAGLVRFSWVCPGCGGATGGYLGDHPVSGWESPRWVNSGTREKPALTPSLGCPLWREGKCDGHWWLRDGRLERA